MKNAIFYTVGAILTVAIVALIVLAGPSKYKYAYEIDEQRVEIYEYNDEGIYQVGVDSNEYDDYLAKIKPMVKVALADRGFDISFVNWDEFDMIEKVKIIPEDQIQTLSATDQTIVNSTSAFYHNETIYLAPHFFEEDDNNRLYTIIHELLHSIIPEDKSNQLNEGIVDYYACAITASKTIGYPLEVVLISWMFDIYGEQRVFEAFTKNEQLELIDSSTETGMGKRLTLALLMNMNDYLGLKSYYSTTEILNVVADIMCHAAIKEKNHNTKFLDIIYNSSKTYDEPIDYEYFSKLLK